MLLNIKKLTLIIMLAFGYTITYGWGATGHRAIGLIAEKHLTLKAKKRIQKILGNESIAMASTWMDEIRSDSIYDYMTDWHWVTIENGKTYDESPKNKNGDLVLAIENMIKELKNKKTFNSQKSEYLKLLIHLIGDLHQPLHVGCCNDKGGNTIKIKWFGKETDLHSIWDFHMIDDSKLSYTEMAQSFDISTKKQIKEWQQSSIRDWLTESMSVREQIYDIGKGRLGYSYAYKNTPLLRKKIVQAGIRLAGILNKIYN